MMRIMSNAFSRIQRAAMNSAGQYAQRVRFVMAWDGKSDRNDCSDLPGNELRQLEPAHE